MARCQALKANKRQVKQRQGHLKGHSSGSFDLQLQGRGTALRLAAVQVPVSRGCEGERPWAVRGEGAGSYNGRGKKLFKPWSLRLTYTTFLLPLRKSTVITLLTRRPTHSRPSTHTSLSYSKLHDGASPGSLTPRTSPHVTHNQPNSREKRYIQTRDCRQALNTSYIHTPPRPYSWRVESDTPELGI